MYSDVALRAIALSKTYTLYGRPIDRLLAGVWRGRRQYGTPFAALTDVSFEVRRGAVMGIVGRNGAGKSTLLQLVCGTLSPSSGSIEVNGRIAALLELGAGFNPDFSGRENVFMNAAILGLSDAEIAQRFDAIVDFSGVRDHIDQPVKTYSSGMYIRLAFAIATSVEPDILVIDEALSVGDGAFARKSFDRIMDMKARGTTILFCSHSTYHVEALCERAVWLESGRVRMLDNAPSVMAAYNAALATEFAAATTPVESAAGIPSAPEPPGKAGGRIISIEGACDGLNGRQLCAISQKSTLKVTVHFFSNPALPLPTIGLGFESASGIGVTSVFSLGQPAAIVRDANGYGQACVVFPELALLKGQYRVTAYLACERGLHVYDVAPQCMTLNVSQSGLLQGFAVIPHCWITNG